MSVVDHTDAIVARVDCSEFLGRLEQHRIEWWSIERLLDFDVYQVRSCRPANRLLSTKTRAAARRAIRAAVATPRRATRSTPAPATAAPAVSRRAAAPRKIGR